MPEKNLLNEKEAALFAVFDGSNKPLTITDAAVQAFPEENGRGTSWVRNGLRKLLSHGLVRQVGVGTYEKTGRLLEEVGTDDIELGEAAELSEDVLRKVIVLGSDNSLTLDVEHLGAEVIVIVGARNFGKTYLAFLIAEQIYRFNQTAHLIDYMPLPFVFLDSMGVGWGLRVSADGVSPGLPVVIWGGKHGDIPLTDHPESAGRRAAHVTSKLRYPGGVVFDLVEHSLLYQCAFIKAFSEAVFYEQDPIHVILDEAHVFLPQDATAEESRMVRSIGEIINRGRKKGIGITLISQRFANISKRAISQPTHLFVLRQLSDNDARTARRWLGAKCDVLNMRPGDAYYKGMQTVAPLRIKIARRETFSSSNSPSLVRLEKEKQLQAREHISPLPPEVLDMFRSEVG